MTDLKNLHIHPSTLGNNSIKFKFVFAKDDGSFAKELTWKQFIQFLKEKDEDFFKMFKQALEYSANALNSAYFWECPPVSQETLNKPFGFVVIKSQILNDQIQDPSKYKGFINNNSNAYVFNFPSFRGTNLIVPAPWLSDQEKSVSGSVKWEEGLKIRDYSNISRFTENAPLEQQREFWGKVAEELSQNLETNSAPQWLSTNGLGASYLHVRICKNPEYYQCKAYLEYKETKNEEAEELIRENDKSEDSKGGSLFKVGVCVVVFLLAFSLFILIPSKKKKKRANKPLANST